MEENKKVKWHPAFYGAIEYELKDDRNHLEFESEHQLSKEPLKMDMLIIKKSDDIRIKKPIGWIFREHNIVEYKAPGDALTIDTLYKTVGYACIYKALGNSVNEIPNDSMSISLFRNAYPRELMSMLSQIGACVDNPHPGIYYINGIINIPLQIVVTRQVSPEDYSALRVLTDNADKEDVRRFIEETAELTMPIDRQNTDAVLQASVQANFMLYEQIRREGTMCEALRELMKDEIEKEVEVERAKAIEEGRAEGKTEGSLETLCALVNDGLIDIKEAARRMNMTEKAFGKSLKEICG